MMKRLACRARKEIACESESPHNNNVRKTSSLAPSTYCHHFFQDYTDRFRRRHPWIARPTTPIPSRVSVDGSGTAD